MRHRALASVAIASVLATAPASAQVSDTGLVVSARGGSYGPAVAVGAVNLHDEAAPSADVRRFTLRRPMRLRLTVPAIGTRLGALTYVDESGHRTSLTLRLLRRQANHTDRYVLGSAGGASVVLRAHDPTLLAIVLPERSGSPGVHVHDPRVVLSQKGARMMRFDGCAPVRLSARIEPAAAGQAFDSSATLTSHDLRAASLCR